MINFVENLVDIQVDNLVDNQVDNQVHMIDIMEKAEVLMCGILLMWKY